jgi:hypothetical protein
MYILILSSLFFALVSNNGVTDGCATLLARLNEGAILAPSYLSDVLDGLGIHAHIPE